MTANLRPLTSIADEYAACPRCGEDRWTGGGVPLEASHYRRGTMTECQPTPVVGMPATYSIGSDSYAAEVVSVSKSGHKIEARVGRGSKAETFTRRKNGAYVLAGTTYGHLTLGMAREYRDPSF